MPSYRHERPPFPTRQDLPHSAAGLAHWDRITRKPRAGHPDLFLPIAHLPTRPQKQLADYARLPKPNPQSHHQYPYRCAIAFSDICCPSRTHNVSDSYIILQTQSLSPVDRRDSGSAHDGPLPLSRKRFARSRSHLTRAFARLEVFAVNLPSLLFFTKCIQFSRRPSLIENGAKPTPPGAPQSALN
jgi:hypothetical protein